MKTSIPKSRVQTRAEHRWGEVRTRLTWTTWGSAVDQENINRLLEVGPQLAVPNGLSTQLEEAELLPELPVLENGPAEFFRCEGVEATRSEQVSVDCNLDLIAISGSLVLRATGALAVGADHAAVTLARPQHCPTRGTFVEA